MQAQRHNNQIRGRGRLSPYYLDPMQRKQQEPLCECIFEGKDLDNFPGTQYPCWRYHKQLDPLLVNNSEEDEECKKEGYDDPCAPVSANKQLMNWYWDLEDMSVRQLRVFALDEFEVDLPEASQEVLMKAVTQLSKYSPQNNGRIVLMAHTIKMNYTETLAEIERMQATGVAEVTKEVFEA